MLARHYAEFEMPAATHEGKPCRVCQHTLRYDSSGACVRCAREAAQAHRGGKPFAIRARIAALEARIAALESNIQLPTPPAEDPLLR